ncbi:hypothetical protein GH714_030631 [Hevea brasiliensis]|uniref:Fe2OG dioxygenase domain-containing protein n=1 Tax=Hevea brasiliensis TaxID=3981 RepID=A0A6A6LCC7_HEVBR|nr:hypothetical protein GH714_030631 [Hevea brasiliensis]
MVQKPKSINLLIPQYADSSLVLKSNHGIPFKSSVLKTPTPLDGSINKSHFEPGNYGSPSILQARLFTNARKGLKPQVSNHKNVKYDGTPTPGIPWVSPMSATPLKDISRTSLGVLPDNDLHHGQFDSDLPEMEQNGFAEQLQSRGPLYSHKVTANVIAMSGGHCGFPSDSAQVSGKRIHPERSDDGLRRMTYGDDAIDIGSSGREKGFTADDGIVNGGPRWRSDESSDEEDEHNLERAVKGASYRTPRRGIRRSSCKMRIVSSPFLLAEPLIKCGFLAGLHFCSMSSNSVSVLLSSFSLACVEYGFFYLVNHGVEEELLARVFEESRKFFSLPLAAKMNLLRKEHRGYTPLYAENLDPSSSSKGDSKESFYIGPLEKSCLNQWPSQVLLAREFQNFSLLGDPPWSLTIAKLCELGHFEEQIFGASAHSDYGMITLLVTDGVPGLQVCREKFKDPQTWENVFHMNGAFIVNIGDMMERWTNCLFRSTLHRVMPTGQERYSLAFFLDPNTECIVQCLGSCCSESRPQRFPPIRSGDYLKERLMLTYGS